MQNSFNYIRKYFIFILLLVPFFFFFSPKVEESQCFKPIKYNSATLYMHNCDNNSITSSSMNYINYIFEWENNPWRGRPLHILVGTLGAPVLLPFAVLYNKLLKNKINTPINKKKFFKKSSVYFSYYLFHLLIIYLIIFVICKFLNFNLNSFNAFFAGLIVMTSDLVVSFFWQTHSSFLLILVPVISVLSFFIGSVGTYVEKQKFYSYCFILGCGSLFYQMCVIWLPMLVIGYIWSSNRYGNLELKNIFRIIFIFLLPLITWITFCLFFDLKIFYEAKWSFVWIFEVLQSGDFKILEKKIFKFLENFKDSFNLGYLILIVPILAFIFSEDNRKIKSKLLSLFSLVCLLSLFFHLSFHFLQGYYQPRAINVTYLIAFMWVVWLNQRNFKLIQFTFITIFFMQVYNMLTKVPLTYI